jgi:Sulphur transport
MERDEGDKPCTMSNPSDPTHLVAALGFALAFAFGAVAQRTHFCTMGAVADIVGMGHWGRMRMWLLAIAVAILGASTLVWLTYRNRSIRGRGCRGFRISSAASVSASG